MTGTKYVLKNNTTSVQFFDYRTLSESMWFYQVQLNPGQTKTIWAELGSLKLYNNNAITIEEQSSFPPVHADISGGGSINQQIDYKNKSILTVSTLVGSTNIGYSVLNFDGNSIYGPIDLGYNTASVPGGYWYINNVYPLTNSGYAIYLNNNDNNNKTVIFLNYSGQILGQYSASTSNYNYDVLDGQFVYFNDIENGVFNYSDGKTFKSREFDPNYDFYVETNYDGCIKDGFVIRQAANDYSSYTLFTMDREIPLTTWDNNYTTTEIFLYQNSNFITSTSYSNNNGVYFFYNIYSPTGNLLHSINLTQDYNYSNYDVNFFGTNKMNIIFYNNGNNAVPYLIYTYDGDTDTLLSTTHENNGVYNQWETYFDNVYGADSDFPSQDLHINFWNNNGGNYDFYQVLYSDILSYFEGDTTYRTPYVVSNNESNIWVNVYGGFLGTSLIRPYYNTNDNILKLLVVTTDGVSFKTITSLSTLDTYYIDNWEIGDVYIFKTFTSNSCCGVIYAYDSLGNQLDYKLFNNWNNSVYNYGTFYYNDNSGSNYFNTKTLKFNVFSSYSYNVDTPNTYYSDTFKRAGNIYLDREGITGVPSVMITENNITPEIVLPTINCCEFYSRVGKDVLLYVYVNDNDNLTINLYNLSLSLLQSLVVTQFDYVDTAFVVENRAYVQIHFDGVITYYMVSANGIKSVELADNNNYRVANDYAWWND